MLHLPVIIPLSTQMQHLKGLIFNIYKVLTKVSKKETNNLIKKWDEKTTPASPHTHTLGLHFEEKMERER